jgi:hypothetical protein
LGFHDRRGARFYGAGGVNFEPGVTFAETQLGIRLEVQRLHAMTTELKDEVDRTNSNRVLNLAVLKRAQEIEKLAKGNKFVTYAGGHPRVEVIAAGGHAAHTSDSRWLHTR